jgi:type VI secretion system protein ImpG
MRPRNALTELYASELAYLQDAGRALALASPDDAAALLAQSDDPDVERLLEGVAFLTAGLRARIDQASAQISHGLAELLLPHFLRSLPAATIIEFSPDIRALRTRPRIARGRLLRARPIDGTVCRFRTCFDVDLWPLTVRDARLDHPSGQRPRLTLTLELADSGRALLSEPKPLRFFIHHASTALPATLLLWLTQKKHLHRVTVHSGGGPPVELPDAVTPLSADTSAVFPWPDTAPIGYRSVLELFALPQKFCFFDLHGLERAPLDASELVLTFEFHSPPPLNAAVGPDTFHLHCTPAINLFECPGQPITHSPLGRESIVRAEGFDPRHIEVHELLSVTATGRVEGGRAVIPPFTRRAGVPSEGRSYALRRAPSPADGNVDTYLTLVPPSDPGRTEQPPEHELLSLELLCTNRELAGELRRGDISENTPGGTFRSYTNLLDPSPPVRLALGQEALWRLLSHLALNQRGPADADSLRALLRLYNFYALSHAERGPANDRQIDAIRGLSRQAVTRLVRGVPMRAIRTTIELDERNFSGIGPAYLFGQVLDDLLGSLVPINAASELYLRLLPSRQEFTWELRLGL